MGNTWIGQALEREVHTTTLARTRGEGFAVFLGEETDVKVILGTATEARKRYSRLMRETGASTGGFYRVRRDNDGKRWRVTAL